MEQVTSKGCAIFILGVFQAPTGPSPEQPGLTPEPALLWEERGIPPGLLWSEGRWEKLRSCAGHCLDRATRMVHQLQWAPTSASFGCWAEGTHLLGENFSVFRRGDLHVKSKSTAQWTERLWVTKGIFSIYSISSGVKKKNQNKNFLTRILCKKSTKSQYEYVLDRNT